MTRHFFIPRLAVLFVVLATMSGAGLRADDVGSVARLPESVGRVVFLGDSITYAGTFAADIETYFLTRHIGRVPEFINVGLKSETVSGLSEPGHAGGKYPRPDLHDRLDRVLRALRPDLVVACYGMNDGIYEPFDEERFRAYREGVTRLETVVRQAGAHLIFLTPPGYDGRTRGKAFYEDVLRRYSDWLLAQREARDWQVVDVHGPMVQALDAGIAHDPNFTLTRDGVHPLEYGHWLMARMVLQHLGSEDLDGVESASAMAAVHPEGERILNLVRRRSDMMRDAWLTAIGHQRPMPPGLPLAEALELAGEVGGEISAWRDGSASADPDDLRFGDRLKPVSPESFFRTEGYYNWGGSILRDEHGTYHLFYSRWPKEYGFSAWLTQSEIAHATAASAGGPWTYRTTVMKGRGAGHWDAVTAHNPKIKAFDGKYYLYYIATHWNDRPGTATDLLEAGHNRNERWWHLRGNQRTGVAVAESLSGPWRRADVPLLEPSGPITNIVVNPAIAQGKTGRFHLVVKGDKPGIHGRIVRDQAIALSASPTGPFTIQPTPVIDDLDTEDMSIWFDEGRGRFYGVFHAVGRPSDAFIGMVTSVDGIQWDKAAEYELTQKSIRLTDGSVFVPDRMERPFVYCENGEPVIMSVAVREGDDSFIVCMPVANPVPSRSEEQ